MLCEDQRPRIQFNGEPKTRYEFGIKVSVAVTNAVAKGGQFVIGMQSLPGHPYNGYSLQAQTGQTTRLTGIKPDRVYVDRGYRGHDAEDKKGVYISGQRRGLTLTIKRDLKRRNERHRPGDSTTSSMAAAIRPASHR